MQASGVLLQISIQADTCIASGLKLVPFLRHTSARTAVSPICCGHLDEWHLDLGNPFRHIAFDLAARPCEPCVVIASPLFRARLEAIGAVRHAMRGDGTQ